MYEQGFCLRPQNPILKNIMKHTKQLEIRKKKIKIYLKKFNVVRTSRTTKSRKHRIENDNNELKQKIANYKVCWLKHCSFVIMLEKVNLVNSSLERK